MIGRAVSLTLVLGQIRYIQTSSIIIYSIGQTVILTFELPT